MGVYTSVSSKFGEYSYLYLFLGKQKQKPNSSHIYIHSGSLSVITVSSSSWHFTDGTGRVRRLTNRSHRQHRTRWLIRFLIPSARPPLLVSGEAEWKYSAARVCVVKNTVWSVCMCASLILRPRQVLPGVWCLSDSTYRNSVLKVVWGRGTGRGAVLSPSP